MQHEFHKSKSEMEFTDWVAKKYGIEIDIIDGMYGASYIVVDEAKYTFYKLKYG